ncbi:unnamed protein product [Sphagnum jensenii]|uniref:SET domain-containing protein n=1 Tax=Sphagnum jensenii TaxID=128206 RepID=A0ABP0VMT0_9BRYO
MHKLATSMCDDELGSLVKASISMQKPALMEVHMSFMKQFSQLERDWQLMAAKPETQPAKKKTVSLEGMCSIRLLELKVGKRYHIHVRYAMPCAEALFLNLIQTMVEDEDGAAAWMKSCHYERALKDAYEALILEPHHLKSIHWKGCALHGMQQYELACKCFELVLEQSPEKDIKLALQKSKTCDTQSKLGVYELSKYLVGGFEGPLPEFRDYVGPVEIRSSEVVHNGSHATGKNTSPLGCSNAFLRDELLCSLSNLLLKSPTWLEQACSLAGCECHRNTKVPPLELFRPNSKWTAGEEVILAYVNTLLPKQMRHDLLDKDSWEFTCSCLRCDLEPNLRAPLKQLQEEDRGIKV